MNAQHTPGPWAAHFTGGAYAIMSGDYPRVAYVHDLREFDSDGNIKPSTQTTTEANARLIAAAPDLLAVCQAIEAHCSLKTGAVGQAHADEGKRLREQMRAAIAKAEGH